jgi:AraC family transcriptional regulator
MYKEFHSLDELSPLVIEGLTVELLAETFRAAQPDVKYFDAPWIKRARDLVQARFNDTLMVSEIAESVGVHPVHLTRVFRRRFGCTVGEYVRQLRVDFACWELSNSQQAAGGDCVKRRILRSSPPFANSQTLHRNDSL